jgi:hypothetical protein
MVEREQNVDASYGVYAQPLKEWIVSMPIALHVSLAHQYWGYTYTVGWAAMSVDLGSVPWRAGVTSVRG